MASIVVRDCQTAQVGIISCTATYQSSFHGWNVDWIQYFIHSHTEIVLNLAQFSLQPGQDSGGWVEKDDHSSVFSWSVVTLVCIVDELVQLLRIIANKDLTQFQFY